MLQSFESDLTSPVIDHIDGCFLVARLNIYHVISLATIKKIRQALESPPADNKESCGRTIERIAKQSTGRKSLTAKRWQPRSWCGSAMPNGP